MRVIYKLVAASRFHDTGHVLSEYLDGIMIRANSHEMVKELAEHTTMPVINGLTDIFHPCQALADLLTILEVKGSLKGKKVAYVGDGNNVAHSLSHCGRTCGDACNSWNARRL